MNNPKPIKRHKDMQPISREHHFGLLLCWKIRTGLTHKISVDRIKKHNDWFYENFLKPHFKIEEKYLFPILGFSHPYIKKAMDEHLELHILFQSNTDIENCIIYIEKKLSAHIRFEERILFNEIQQIATEEQLIKISTIHTTPKLDDNDWLDKYWIK